MIVQALIAALVVGAPPANTIRLPTCRPDWLEEATLEALLRVEGVFAEVTEITLDVPDCSDRDTLDIRVGRSGEIFLGRVISLGDIDRTARMRTLVLVIGELGKKWQPKNDQDGQMSRRTERPGGTEVQDGQRSRRTGRPMETPVAATSTRSFSGTSPPVEEEAVARKDIMASFVFRIFPTDGAMLMGGRLQLMLELGPHSRFVVSPNIGLDLSQIDLALGSVELGVATIGASFDFIYPVEDLRLGAGLWIEGGWSWTKGRSEQDVVHTGSDGAPILLMGPLIRIHVGSAWGLVSELKIGGTIGGLQAVVKENTVAGATGFCLELSIGTTLSL